MTPPPLIAHEKEGEDLSNLFSLATIYKPPASSSVLDATESTETLLSACRAFLASLLR